MSAVYLNSFEFPGEEQEWYFFMDIKRTCYDSFYPFQILSRHNFSRIDFEPVTILYGGNGSFKRISFFFRPILFPFFSDVNIFFYH